jgi:Zn-dependent peptidase ImmA (M78 family)
MKPPSHIKIKNKCVYEIVHIDTFKDPEVLGECRFQERQIVIKKGQSERQELQTLIHEILHAVCEERGIGVAHKDIYKLEHALEYLLRANKWI